MWLVWFCFILVSLTTNAIIVLPHLGSVSHWNSSSTVNITTFLIGTLHAIDIIFAVTTILLGRYLVKDWEFNILEGLLLIGHRKPFYDIGEHAFATHSWLLKSREFWSWTRLKIFLFLWALVGRDQARNDFISNIFGGSMQHIFELLCWESLNDNIFLFFSQFVFLLELFQLDLLSLTIGTEPSLRHSRLDIVRFLECLQLLLVEALQQPLASLLHLDQPTFESLPQLVVLLPAHVGAVPDCVLYELLDLVHPLRLQHILFHAPNGYHQTRNILDQDIVSSDQKLLTLFRSIVICGTQSWQKSIVAWGLFRGKTTPLRNELLLWRMSQIIHGILIMNSVQFVQLLEAFLILTVQNLTILTEWGVRDPPTFLDHVVAQIVWGWVVTLQNRGRVLRWLTFRICNRHLLEPTKSSVVIFHNS